ncbi:helix-turn-helix domain-containing protein, partial [Nocardia otitidiscaviarum]|uniref:helix-turn-helix domain-containing protein n=1 Tax=Nocardia otitidiscaviarum TaxID=1823 RepID=UPI0011DC7DC0
MDGMTQAHATTSGAPWVPQLDTFGARLAVLRHKMGWNAKEAAAACGFAQASWRDWEINGRLPRDLPGVCQQIENATGVHHVWLMTGVDVTTPAGTAGVID